MTLNWVDRCIYVPVSGGTGSFVTSAAVEGYLTPAQANATDATSYHYVAQLLDSSTGLPNEWEVGSGVYTAATHTLTRNTIEFNSDGNTSPHNFSAPPNIMLTVLAQDLGITVNLTPVFNGTASNFLVDNSSVVGEYTPTQAVAALPVFTSATSGVVPASGGGATKFLRADGTFSLPAAGGITPQVQFNNSGLLGGFGTWDGTATFALQSGAVPQALQVYNIFTTSSNYERGVFDWTTAANTLTVGAQATGSGTLRTMTLKASSVLVDGPSSNGILYVNGAGLISINADAGINRIFPGVLAFGNASSTPSGWFQWGGQARVTSQFNATSTTTLANVTGLSVNVVAARTYTFESTLFTQSNTAGGVQVTVGGSCTGTTVVFEGTTIDGTTIVARTRALNLGSTVGLATAVSTARIDIVGTITVVNGGTLTIQFAQAASSGTASSVLVGSKLLAYDMP